MNILMTKNYEEMSKLAAEIIEMQLTKKADSVLGLPTGSTPVGTYKKLVEDYKRGIVSFANVRSVNLDEYMGLAPGHEQSYRYFMEINFFKHIDIAAENTFVPSGLTENVEDEGKRYDELIESFGGVDLMVLGLGYNGHIGFNEPSDFFPMCTHGVALDESTIEANKRFFASVDEVPKSAITMGIGSIMKAKILLLVSGAEKARILRDTIMGKVTPQIPASILQMHPDVTVIADEVALMELSK